jgi:hypothetical protein
MNTAVCSFQEGFNKEKLPHNISNSQITAVPYAAFSGWMRFISSR